VTPFSPFNLHPPDKESSAELERKLSLAAQASTVAGAASGMVALLAGGLPLAVFPAALGALLAAMFNSASDSARRVRDDPPVPDFESLSAQSFGSSILKYLSNGLMPPKSRRAEFDL
jgi:hypothetical protein